MEIVEICSNACKSTYEHCKKFKICPNLSKSVYNHYTEDGMCTRLAKASVNVLFDVIKLFFIFVILFYIYEICACQNEIFDSSSSNNNNNNSTYNWRHDYSWGDLANKLSCAATADIQMYKKDWQMKLTPQNIQFNYLSFTQIWYCMLGTFLSCSSNFFNNKGLNLYLFLLMPLLLVIKVLQISVPHTFKKKREDLVYYMEGKSVNENAMASGFVLMFLQFCFMITYFVYIYKKSNYPNAPTPNILRRCLNGVRGFINGYTIANNTNENIQTNCIEMGVINATPNETREQHSSRVEDDMPPTYEDALLLDNNLPNSSSKNTDVPSMKNVC